MIRNVEYNLKPSRFCGFQPTINSPIDVNKLYSSREYSLRYERNLCAQQRVLGHARPVAGSKKD